jgi:hypothetical protein
MKENMPKNLWKTKITIWSDYDPQSVALEDLARDATSGEAYCSKNSAVLVENPTEDLEWDGNKFFDCDEENDEKEE